MNFDKRIADILLASLFQLYEQPVSEIFLKLFGIINNNQVEPGFNGRPIKLMIFV